MPVSLLKLDSNSKLGKGIASFNIPAVTTCPGRTKECEKVCYATHGYFRFPKMKAAYEALLEDTKQDNFVSRINKELKSPKIKAVRIHASGDFYNEEYINKWIQIISDNPNVKFWGYTRSWRLKELEPSLKKLSQLSNMQLFASLDSECENDKPDWLRHAYLKKDFTLTPNKSAQCPNQKNKSITCSKCTFCFKDETKSKPHITFAIH